MVVYSIVMYLVPHSAQYLQRSKNFLPSPLAKNKYSQGSILPQALFQHAVGSTSDHLRSTMQSLDHTNHEVFGDAIVSILHLCSYNFVERIEKCRKKNPVLPGVGVVPIQSFSWLLGCPTRQRLLPWHFERHAIVKWRIYIQTPSRTLRITLLEIVDNYIHLGKLL